MLMLLARYLTSVIVKAGKTQMNTNARESVRVRKPRVGKTEYGFNINLRCATILLWQCVFDDSETSDRFKLKSRLSRNCNCAFAKTGLRYCILLLQTDNTP